MNLRMKMKQAEEKAVKDYKKKNRITPGQEKEFRYGFRIGWRCKVIKNSLE